MHVKSEISHEQQERKTAGPWPIGKRVSNVGQESSSKILLASLYDIMLYCI